MKLNINIPATPKRTRILAAFMAFLIFALTFQEAFVGWDFGTKVKAATTGPNIYFNTDTTDDTTTGIKDHVSDGFTYTGNLKTSKITMFDYVSDEEINGTYNSINHSIPNGGYDDAYSTLNRVISQSKTDAEPLHDAEDNITIKLTTTSFSPGSTYVYLFKEVGGSTTNDTPWPGARMIYDSDNNCYTYTFNRTDPSSPYYLSFEPNKIQFSDGLDNKSTVFSRTFSTGKTYSYTVGDNYIQYYYKSSDTMYLCLWDEDHPHTLAASSPNTSEHKRFKMSASTYGGNTAQYFRWDSSKTDYVPRRFTFNNGSNWEFSDAGADGLPWNGQPTVKGFTYYFYWNGSLAVTATPNVSQEDANSGTTDALPIYDTKYANPLYFGTFYNGGAASNYDEDSEKPGGTGNNSNGTAINRPGPYNNFYWRPNISFKPDDTNHRGNISVQGLVDDTLKTYNNDTSSWNFDKTGSLTQTNGSTVLELPYFDTSWADSNSSLVKYYNTNGAAGHAGEDIYFPFYEVLTPAYTSDPVNNPISSSVNHLDGSGAFADGEYARFYQFVAKDTNVHFVVSDAANHKGYFEEKSKTAKISSNLNRDSNGDRNNDNNVGFFPFNDTETKFGRGNNRGFGARYDLTFQLQSDGCVGVTNASGADLVNDGTNHTGRIHTIFEFTGDDDLWVFVDGKLVLDMGGAHSQSSGIIDFATGTSTVTYKKALGSTQSDKDNLGVDPDTTTAVDITSLIEGCTVSDGKPTYDGTTHTMTIFYMERGMNDSNLLIRYNYSPMSNFSKMKVQEYTDFSNVNAGLLAKTMEAADYDVFGNYSVLSPKAYGLPQTANKTALNELIPCLHAVPM